MRKRKSKAACLFVVCVAVALVLAGTAAGEVSRNGLVAEYHFDGDAKDSSGNGNDGIIYGATFIDGKFGKALSFDGANNYVNVAGVWGGTSWKEATIEAWVSTKTTSGDFQAIVSSTSADFVHLQLNSWGNIAIFTDKIKPYIALPIISQKPTGVWRRVAISIKSGNTKLYENGVEVGSDSGTFSYIIPAMELHIGNGYQNGRFFNGLIDEVRVYNRALSAEEIKTNYEVGLTSTPTPTPVKATTSIWNFQPVSVTYNTLLFKVDYYYDGSLGDNVWLGAKALEDGDDGLFWISYRPNKANLGAGSATIRLGYDANNPPPRADSLYINVIMYVGGEYPFYEKKFYYPKIWTTEPTPTPVEPFYTPTQAPSTGNTVFIGVIFLIIIFIVVIYYLNTKRVPPPADTQKQEEAVAKPSMGVSLKELNDRLDQITALFDKLDESLAQGEITEAKYKELTEKYRAEADSLKDQIAEKKFM